MAVQGQQAPYTNTNGGATAGAAVKSVRLMLVPVSGKAAFATMTAASFGNGRMTAASAFLYFNVLVFGVTGLAALAAPAALLSGADVILAPDSPVAEIRAFYGGGSLGLAAYFGYCAAGAVLRPGLWAVVLVTGGAFAGRVVGVALGGMTPAMLIIGAFEAVWAAFALWLLTRTRTSG